MNRHVRARTLLGLCFPVLALAACNALTEVGKFSVGTAEPAPDTSLPPPAPSQTKDSGPPSSSPPDSNKDSGPKLHVFVTSDKTIGSFSNLAGGDEFCRNLAERAGHPAAWTAWLSTGDTLADSRLNEGVDGPWYLYGSAPRLAVASRAELQSGKITSPIDVDEQGAKVTPDDDDPNVWTGTSATGGRIGGDCKQWDLQYCIDGVCPYGGAGRSDTSDGGWTAAGQMPCFEHYLRLYCFENPTP